MTPENDDRAGPSKPGAAALEPLDTATGLPWPRTWPGIERNVTALAWVAITERPMTAHPVRMSPFT